MGFTLPHKYGGLNCPNLIYTVATEIVSRADGSLMNIFGLQGIAETINAFASEEIKAEFLPRFCEGEVTGAMVLTEPDAGSDLQAIRLRAEQDENGVWRLNGVKRFITNGCGEILLTLARSEPNIADGRGLSLFISERSEHIKVRHLEHKLGIHGSPTCELVYTNAPARLVGERQRGLITYVLALMNGARVGIAAQSLGIAEAAYRLARTYAHSRQQFGGPIERLPAVAEMITDMNLDLQAARALTYETSRICDQENNNLRVLEFRKTDPEDEKRRKKLSRELKRLNSMLTPMSKYLASEMCCRVANTTIQVLGGSGYMRDYPAERYLRDSRITTIYEGTSQLQVVAAKLIDSKQHLLDAIAFVKTRSASYLDLAGRRMVDCALFQICGHLLLQQATKKEAKKRAARRYIEHGLAEFHMRCDQILAGDTSPLDEYDVLAGPVPRQATR